MKVTVYSSDPIDEALRVVGSLYGVRIEVSANEQPTVTEATAPARRSTQSSPRTGARTRARVAAASTARTTRKRSTPAAVTTPSADVRVWAREHGQQVNDRGPLPAEVLAAYAAAH